jgi:hypothetical protein
LSSTVNGVENTNPVTWTVYQHDVGVIKLQTIVDSTGTVRNLTGMTGATLRIFKPGYNDATYVYATISMSIVNPPTSGMVQWQIGATDLVNVPPATYAASIFLLGPGGYEEHAMTFTMFLKAAP